MHVEVSDKKTWTPAWNGNKELPADQRVVFSYAAPTVQDRKRIVAKSNVKFEYDKDGNPTGGSGEIDLDNESPVRAVKDLVITNLTYEKGGATVNIVNADGLLKAPAEFYGLIKEFAEHLRDEAKKEAPEKN